MTYLEAVNRYLDMVRVTRLAAVAGATGEGAVAKWLINEAMRDLFYKYDWPWRRKSDVLQTVAVYETGTVSVTNGSATVTGSGTTFTAAMVGRKFRVDGDGSYYDISARVSDTEITLADVYIGDTDSGLDYQIYQDSYSLAGDVDRMIGMQLPSNEWNMVFGTNVDAYDFQPNPTSTGAPEAIIINERSSTGAAWVVRFVNIPDAVYQFPYQYYFEMTDMAADADDFETVNRIPPKLHQLIVDRAYVRGLGSGREDDPIMARTLESRWEQAMEREIGASRPDKGLYRVMREHGGPRRRRFVRFPPSYPDVG